MGVAIEVVGAGVAEGEVGDEEGGVVPAGVDNICNILNISWF